MNRGSPRKRGDFCVLQGKSRKALALVIFRLFRGFTPPHTNVTPAVGSWSLGTALAKTMSFS
jgi:hypothetical protein